MAAENDLNGGGTELSLASTSRTQVLERDAGTSTDDQKKEKEIPKVVPFYKLFAFADSQDVILMIIGTIAAVGNGICMPLMSILIGELTDAFGQNQNNDEVVDKVSKVSLEFVYLAIGAGTASFLQVACWMVTGERQAARIRSLYLRTILRQDVSFFDVETNTGEVVGRMSGDTVLIQDAMGEKVGKFTQLVATFIGGFAVAFFKGWLLTLVMLSSIPPLVIAGGMMSLVIARMSSRGQEAYAKAAVALILSIWWIMVEFLVFLDLKDDIYEDRSEPDRSKWRLEQSCIFMTSWAGCRSGRAGPFCRNSDFCILGPIA